MLQPLVDALVWWDKSLGITEHIILDNIIIFTFTAILIKITYPFMHRLFDDDFFKEPLPKKFFRLYFAIFLPYLLLYWAAVFNLIMIEGASRIDWEPRIFGGMPAMMAGKGGVIWWNHLNIAVRIIRSVAVNFILINPLFYVTSGLLAWYCYKLFKSKIIKPIRHYSIFLFLWVFWIISIDWGVG